jgi:hypothetical protein
MMHAAGVQRIAERLHHMFLAHQFGEFSRPPLAREYLI